MERIDAVGTRAGEALELQPRAGERAGGGGPSFGSVIGKALSETERLHEEADGMVKGLAEGEITDVHQVMLAMNRADLSFRMVLEVRNKLLEAYQEVMRTHV